MNHIINTTGNFEVVTEAFNDCLNSIVNFFNDMIQKIKDFFKRIAMIVDSQFKEIDKFVEKYKSKLECIKGVDFNITGYHWTMNNPPDMSEFKDIVNNYNTQLAEIPNMSKAEISNMQAEYLTNDNLDRIRGLVLGTSGPIDEGSFNEYVRRYYRDGDIDPCDIHVDDSLYRNTLNNMQSLVKDRKQAEKTRDELLILLDKTLVFFDKKISVVYKNNSKMIRNTPISIDNNVFTQGDSTDSSYSDSTLEKINVFMKFKYNQVNKIASIINLVASERANAYKDQVKMSKEIIMKALATSKLKNTDEGGN